MDFLEYPDVSSEIRGAMVDGKLKMTDSKLVFKGGKSGSKNEVDANQMEMVSWQRMAGTWGIRIFTKDGSLQRFAGFKDAERERLAKFFKQNYSLDMLDRELSVKGWNYGTANFKGGVLGFEVGNKEAFEIPLSYVNQCLPGKNEVTLEFHNNDDAAVMLSEMRFHIPQSNLAGADDPVEAFKEQVMKKASVVTTAGDAIAIFSEIHCLSPRGRYDIKVFPTFFHLHGKTFDYKISLSNVIRLFMLPHKDQRQMHFVVNVDPPIKQGQTRYHYLVFNFKLDDEVEIELPFTEEELQEKYDGKLEKEMSGETYKVVSKVLKVVTGKKITEPKDFSSHYRQPVVTCSHKAASGFLYPLERGLIFVYKPPIFLRYDELRSVSFERSGGSTRSFDINAVTRNDISYTFSSIEKDEYTKLYEYLKSKKVSVRTAGKGSGAKGLSFVDVDHHLEKVKKDALSDMEDSGSMSSDDSEFNPDALEALSAKEEYDSEPTTTSSDESEDDFGSGSDAERKREEKRSAKKERRIQRAAAAAEKGEKSEKKKKGPKGEKRERRKKLVKLPGQPKRATSSYMIWMNATRESINKDNPGATIGEIAKKAGELWKTLGDKSEWEAKAAEDKKRYETEMEKWKAEGGLEQLKAAKKEAKKEARLAKAGGSKSSPKKKAGKAKASASGPASTSFKSKEFIEDSDSGSGGGEKDKSKSDVSVKSEAGSDDDVGSGDKSMKSSPAASSMSESD